VHLPVTGQVHAVSGPWLDILLVAVFILIGGVFAATELALVSLREGQASARWPRRAAAGPASPGWSPSRTGSSPPCRSA
jgi:putative hemolysin